MAYVYRHIRLDKNTPFYIGIGSDESGFNKRAYSPHNRGQLWKRIAAVSKYEVDILFDDVSLEFAKSKEVEFISLYKRINDGGTLANITGGGDGWFDPPKECRERLIKRNIGNKHHLGKKHSDESKAAISEKRKGLYCGINNPSYKGVVTALKDGVPVGEFNGVKDCANKLKINLTNISACLNGNRKTVGGYTFKRDKVL